MARLWLFTSGTEAVSDNFRTKAMMKTMKKIVIPLLAATIQFFGGVSQAWQVKPEVSQKAAEIILHRMSQPQNYIPQPQDATWSNVKSHNSAPNQLQSTLVDNDEEAIKLIEETYRQLEKDKKIKLTPRDVENILSQDAPLITFLGLTNGLIQLPVFYRTMQVYFNTNKMPFEKVIENVSLDMEKEFDLFIFINTSEGSTKKDLFPRGQRIKYFRRTNPGTPIFARNKSGVISGLNRRHLGASIQTESELASYVNDSVRATSMDADGILTSTGIASGGGMRTLSGIYRLGRTTQPHGQGMIYTMFIDYQYLIDEENPGKVSGMAIHGTPTSNVPRLGSRASHGCARIEPNLAGVWRSLMFNRTLKPGSIYTEGVRKFPQRADGWNLEKEDLMDFNRFSQLPSQEEQVKNPDRTRPGFKALMILFDGYANPDINL